MTSLIRFTFLFVFISLCIVSIGQTGPGGVGNSSGSSSLDIWLMAGDIDADLDETDNPSNGSSISTWSDLSGNSNNFTQAGSNRPTYITTGTFNAVNFNASAGTAQFMNGAISGSNTSGSTFLVHNSSNSGISNSMFDNGSFSLRVEQYNNTGLVGFTRYGVADYSTAITSPFGTNTIYSYHKSGASTNLEIRVAGTSETINIGSAAAGIPYDRLGKNSSGSDEMSGDAFEVLVYNTVLNSAQIIIVENYLSAKYGSLSIANDIYNEDTPGNGNYDHDVAGIGRINASNIHDDSQGTGIVRILNPTGLGNNEFMFWGHDNGNLNATETVDVPVGVDARFVRVWRVSERNTNNTSNRNVGNVDVRWDLSGLGSVDATDLRLIIDTDDDGLFADQTPISGATHLGGNIYEFAGVSGGSAGFRNNRRFTLGTADNGDTPLPIELASFSASRLSSSQVELNWSTITETNNDYFEILRSENGKDWEQILREDGAGNSTSSIDYSSIDGQATSQELFYKLRQVDFDGQSEEFDVVVVPELSSTDFEELEMTVFPNPIEIGSKLNIELKNFKAGNTILILRNPQGKEYFAKVVQLQGESAYETIDISEQIPAGQYIVTATNDENLFSKKLIVK